MTLLIVTISCQKEENETIIDDEAPLIKTFSFKSANNPLTLISDVEFTIEDDVIHALIPNIISESEFIADFTFEGEQILVDGTSQESGLNIVDFSSPVEYVVQNKSGKTKAYIVKVSVFTGLPMVFIHTNNNTPIISKDDYVEGTIKIQENFTVKTYSVMKIKGRGNTTWGMPKKTLQN